jgi:hypothetical protein
MRRNGGVITGTGWPRKKTKLSLSLLLILWLLLFSVLVSDIEAGRIEMVESEVERSEILACKLQLYGGRVSR